MRILRVTLLAGIILLAISAAVFTVFFIIERNNADVSVQQEGFFSILREYDAIVQNLQLTESSYEILNRELERLETRAVSVESWLSILKRRRALLTISPLAMEDYRYSINRAKNIYPSSPPIIAMAAAALVKNAGINNEMEEQLRKWLPLITDTSFNTLRLGFHTILGDFRNPQRASVIPDDIMTDGTESITINLIILKILRRDFRGASADIQIMLNETSSVNALRLAAEYHYDFGDLLRSAEIFSIINDEMAMIRQADALYLAGYKEIAATIWKMLADTAAANVAEANVAAAAPNETSLYNLAVTSDDPNETIALLEKLVSIDTVSNKKSRQFGLIRYSRSLDYVQAISLLRNTVNFSPLDFPYIDLEIAKRFAQGRDLGRQLAEAWLLLDRHPDNEELHKWTTWNFFFLRRFDEARILMDRFNDLQQTAYWIDVYNAILCMYEDDLNTAENILRSIPKDDAGWYVFANLGRIMEARFSPALAIEQYELAVSKVENPKTAARIQIRIGRCLNALNRSREAVLAFRRALELEPENITARLELEKLAIR